VLPGSQTTMMGWQTDDLVREGSGAGGRMSPLVHQGGSMKRKAEAARGAGWGVGAARGATSGSEVPAVEEG
jgi:hypothetical protein